MKIQTLAVTHPSLFARLKRLSKILRRYGFSEHKFASKLKLYFQILDRYNLTPTFPTPAGVLERHPRLTQQLASKIEFAVHGYSHVDYARLSPAELDTHLARSVAIFDRLNLPHCGFRFPYLNWSPAAMDALGDRSFSYDSSHTILWDIQPTGDIAKPHWSNYRNMLGRYNYKRASDVPSLPFRYNSILEIPVSLPDDDLLERLGLTNENIASRIWQDILIQTHARGELFAIQLHPERIESYKTALEAILQTSRRLQPGVWIAPLTEIARWWKERSHFDVRIDQRNSGEFDCQVRCSERAIVLLKDHSLTNSGFYKNYKVINKPCFRVKSNTRPVIGIPENASRQMVQFLEDEGYVVETSTERQKFSVFLDKNLDVSRENALAVFNQIDANPSPLVRIWRWPNKHRSALSVTGDIDALSITDFIFRLRGPKSH
jgi:peptidoglycan/xylan/chitin deacetylase (PgdA/CDA1 family)